MRVFCLPLFFFLLLILLPAASAYAQSFDWTKSVGGMGADDVFDVTTDSQGNSYVAAYVSGTASFGNLSTTGSATDLAVAKFDASGICLWANRVPATVESVVYGAQVTADASGNVYFGYSFPVYSSPSHGSSPYLYHFKLQKYSPAGTLLWSQQPDVPSMFNAAGAALEDILIDQSDCPVLACQVEGPLTIQGQTTTHNRSSALIRFSPSGIFRWIKNINTYPGTWGPGYVRKLTNGPPGQFWVAGPLNGSLTFEGGPTLVSTPQLQSQPNKSFIARYDTTGQYMWGTVLGQGGNMVVAGITEAENNSVALSGRFSGTVTLGSSSYTASLPAQFVLRMSDTGGPLWLHQSYSPTSTSFTEQALTSDSSGNIYLASAFATSVNIDSSTFTSSGGTDILLTKYASATGNVLMATSVGGTGNDVARGIATFATGKIAAVGRIGNGSVQFGADLLVPEGAADGFITRIETEPLPLGNVISGIVFNDLNGNGIRDAGEPPFGQSVILEINPGPAYATSSASGHFSVPVDTGTYTISIPNPTIYHAVLPASHMVTISAQNPSDSTAAFGLHSNGSVNDLRVILTPVNAFRPGFTGTYNLTAESLGGVAISNASLVLHPAPGLVFTQSSLAPAAITADSIVWNFASIAPAQATYFTASFTIPATTPIGTFLTTTADIYPKAGDFVPADNHASERVTVVGSYDPNDKQVSDSVLTPAMVASGKWLEYLIRFQNTGTDTAFFITITDTLSSMLDVATLEMLSASHPYTFEVSGPGIAQWQFNPALLPDSATNEAASHGFVRFRIKPQTTLQLGQVIENSVAIYFDYNQPIITNIAQTTIALPVTTIAPAAISSVGFCAEASFTQPFSASGQYQPGNQFMLQLSDGTGSFANPVVIGTMAGTAAGTIAATLPAQLPAGTGYRIRVTATSPATVGPDNGADLTIWPLPQVSLLLPDSVDMNAPSFALTGGLPAGGSYTGPGIAGGTFNPAAANLGSHTITYTFTDAQGCKAQASQPVVVYQINATAAEVAVPDFRIYPTPASEKLRVEWLSSADEATELVLTDMLGKVIFRELSKTSSGSQIREISVAHLPAGIYVLQLFNGSRSAQAKVIVQK